MRPEKLPDFILVVNPENSTRVVDYRDRSSCILWGDCSTAAVLSPRVIGPWKVAETMLRGDPKGAEKVKVPRFGHFTQMGAEVQKFAIKRGSEIFESLRQGFLSRDVSKKSSDLSFIGHQANLRMLESIVKRCEIESPQHFFNVDRRGNVGAAGAPSVFSENFDHPELSDAVVLAVVGSGLTWSGCTLERTRPRVQSTTWP
jgi:3-oxoacyl-[acyl-carrier-protein] synthase III